MAVPFGHDGFVKLTDLIAIIEKQGCELRNVDGTVVTPWGEMQIRYIFNPNTKGRYDISDFEDDEYLGPSILRSIERRLGIDLDLP